MLFVLLTRYKTPSLIIWTTVGLLVALFIVQVFASDKVPAEDDDPDADDSDRDTEVIQPSPA